MGKMPDRIGDYFRFYNTARPHQALGYRTPGDASTSIPFEELEKGVIESLTPGTIDTAGHYLNLAPLLSYNGDHLNVAYETSIS